MGGNGRVGGRETETARERGERGTRETEKEFQLDCLKGEARESERGGGGVRERDREREREKGGRQTETDR